MHFKLFWQSAAKRKCLVVSEENGLTWMMVEAANSIYVDSFLNKPFLFCMIIRCKVFFSFSSNKDNEFCDLLYISGSFSLYLVWPLLMEVGSEIG